MSRPTTVRRSPWYLGPGVDITPEELDSYEKTGDYTLEVKIDGMWASLEVRDPENGEPHVINSRDARTGPVSGSNLGDLHLQVFRNIPKGTVLVGELEAATQFAKEIVDKNGYRRLHLFDVVRVGEEDRRGVQFFRRTADLRHMLASERSMHDAPKIGGKSPFALRFLQVQHTRADFRQVYDTVVAEGGEGVVLKHSASLYSTKRSDGKTKEWVRCKRWVTMDYVLMGTAMTPGGVFSEPKPTAVWGLYDGKGVLQPVLQAPIKPDHLLNPANYGVLVAEFMGWAKFKSGALRHAQFVRVREDKDPMDCTVEGQEP